ncbi:MAG: GntR family transcriptional regulator, partial [Planctomycetota bacterium]
DGSLAVGARFPTERQIAERFAVSRATANKALSALIAEGLLELRAGIGSFVKAPHLDYDLRALASFTAMAQAAGRQPTTRVLTATRTTAGQLRGLPPDQSLPWPDDQPLLALQRLRLLDGEPVIHEQRWIDRSCSPELSQDELAGSLYAAWEDRHGLRIVGADQRFRAIALDAARARALGLRRGAPALELCCTGWEAGGGCLWYERTCYRGDRYAFRAGLGQLPSGGGAPAHIERTG